MLLKGEEKTPPSGLISPRGIPMIAVVVAMDETFTRWRGSI